MRLNSTVEFSSGQSYSVAGSKTAGLVNSRPKPKDWIVLCHCSLSATTVELSSVIQCSRGFKHVFNTGLRKKCTCVKVPGLSDRLFWTRGGQGH